MSFVTPTPANPFFAANIASIAAGNALDFRSALNNRIAGLDSKCMLLAALSELMSETFGNGAVSGGTITAGVGLSVSVAALTAFVGNYLASDAASTVGGLMNNAFNYLWLRQDGTWTVNQSGIAPTSADGHGEALRWGIVQTDLGGVTGIDENRPLFGSRYLRSEVHVIALPDTTYTLTVSQMDARVLEFTGAITANRLIWVPEPIYGEWIVYNNTSGGHSLVFSPATSGDSVTVPSGAYMLVYFDENRPAMVNPNAAFYLPGGTDVAVADGGTGASTALAARGNLGLYQWDSPANHGLTEWNYPNLLAVNDTVLTSGTLYILKIVPQVGGMLTNLLVNMTAAAATLTAATTAVITNAANNGSGLIRLTSAAHGFSTNDVVVVASVTGTTEANGVWIITVIDANTFDLEGSAFVNPYVSGGSATRSPNCAAVYNSAGSFLGATADNPGTWTTSAVKTMPLVKPISLTSGATYYIALLSVAGTCPQLARCSAGNGLHIGLSGASLNFSVNGTGLTKLPNAITPASNSVTGAVSIWLGLS